MEMEALESLFPVEMSKKNATEFSLVGLVPFSDNSETNFVSLDLGFVYPPGYPFDTPVSVCVLQTTGGIATDTHCLSEIAALVESVSNANIGNACVYQIAESAQLWLRNYNEPERSLHDQMKQSKRMVDDSDDSDDSDWNSSDEEDECSDDEYSDDDGFVGLQSKELCKEADRVTKSQFEAWKIEYDAILLEKGLIKRVCEGDVSLTGKMQFLQNLRGGPSQVLRVAEDLFVDDVELDDDEE